MHQEIDLFDLLNPEPIELAGIGHIRKPKAAEIGKLKFDNYSMYLHMLGISLESFINVMKLHDLFKSIDETQKTQITLFDMIVIIPSAIQLYLQILNFFILEDVVFDSGEKIFQVLTTKEVLDENNNTNVEKTVTGVINRDNYYSLFGLILKTNYVDIPTQDVKKIKSKKAQELVEKIERERKKQKKSNTNDEVSLANVISKLCTYNSGVNMINVWEMTIYQIYSQFYEQNTKNINDIRATNYSYYGGEFDVTEWLRPIKIK